MDRRNELTINEAIVFGLGLGTRRFSAITFNGIWRAVYCVKRAWPIAVRRLHDYRVADTY